MHIMNKIKLSPIKNFGYSVQHIIMTAGNVQHIILYKGKNTLVSDCATIHNIIIIKYVQ
jgi:hypothetical protein